VRRGGIRARGRGEGETKREGALGRSRATFNGLHRRLAPRVIPPCTYAYLANRNRVRLRDGGGEKADWQTEEEREREREREREKERVA